VAGWVGEVATVPRSCCNDHDAFRAAAAAKVIKDALRADSKT
jgi:hypothetical protein